MKNINKNKIFFSFMIFLMCLFSVRASEQALTIKFMLDSSGAMKDQDIVSTSASILAAEINNFTQNYSHLYEGEGASIRILVDSFWQKGNSLQSQGIFDYRLGQSGAPNYDGLRDFKTKWFVNDETTLNKLVNRNWPAENKNTVWLILTNSQETLEANEIIDINNDARKSNSKLVIVTLPRGNNYGDTVLKREIAKRIHRAFGEVKSYIISAQFKLDAEISVNGKKFDSDKTISVAAPVRIKLKAIVSGEKSFFWKYYDVKTEKKELDLEFDRATDFTVSAIGVDSLGNEHIKEIKFNILPASQATAEFSFFPVSGVAPLKISITNRSVNARDYQWDWGDGTPSSSEKSPTHTYNAPGEYTITLNVLGNNGEVVSEKAKIKVTHPIPSAKFEIPSFIAAETECDFTNISQNSTSWSWDFGDGSEQSTEKNPKHKFAKPGTYKVVLRAFNPNGASSTVEKTVVVREKLVADFDWERSPSDPRNLTFKNTSQGAVRYSWDFGDGETSSEENPSHLFESDETRGYLVSLTAFAKNGQKVTQTERITISAAADNSQPLMANFTYAQQTNTTVPKIRFTNTSRGAVKYRWLFGDGNQSTEESPTHTYNIPNARNVNVTLVAIAADGRESKKVLSVKITPVSSGISWGILLGIIFIMAVAGVIVGIKLFKKRKTFAAILFSKDNKPMGQKIVKVGEVVPISVLNGSSDLDFQIVKAEDDSGDDFKIRFRKPEESPAVLKQKALKIHLNDQWSDELDMANLSVDSCRLVFSDDEDEFINEKE